MYAYYSFFLLIFSFTSIITFDKPRALNSREFTAMWDRGNIPCDLIACTHYIQTYYTTRAHFDEYDLADPAKVTANEQGNFFNAPLAIMLAHMRRKGILTVKNLGELALSRCIKRRNIQGVAWLLLFNASPALEAGKRSRSALDISQEEIEEYQQIVATEPDDDIKNDARQALQDHKVIRFLLTNPATHWHAQGITNDSLQLQLIPHDALEAVSLADNQSLEKFLETDAEEDVCQKFKKLNSILDFACAMRYPNRYTINYITQKLSQTADIMAKDIYKNTYFLDTLHDQFIKSLFNNNSCTAKILITLGVKPQKAFQWYQNHESKDYTHNTLSNLGQIIDFIDTTMSVDEFAQKKLGEFCSFQLLDNMRYCPVFRVYDTSHDTAAGSLYTWDSCNSSSEKESAKAAFKADQESLKQLVAQPTRIVTQGAKIPQLTKALQSREIGALRTKRKWGQ